jgi:hypothetical protein
VSGIQKFRAEFEAHITQKRCPMRNPSLGVGVAA